MKITRLTTYREADQVVTIIDMLDELRLALMESYSDEIGQYQQQRWLEMQEQNDNLDLFDDAEF